VYNNVAPMDKPVIEIKNLTKKFGKLLAVDDLSFEVEQGEIFAFLGSNGSGKTTTIRCLLNIYQQDKGEALVQGSEYSHKLNSILGYLPEERGLYTRARVEGLFLYFATLRNIAPDKARELTHEYLKRVGLFEHKNKKISELSSGMQQKVQIGLTIIHEPKILILDEPFKGLDPINRQLFIEMFKQLQDKGSTIMYSTHAIDEAQKMADRLTIIKDGKREVYGSIKQVRQSFGKDNIHLEFAGKLPENKKLYEAKIVNNTAEIIPKPKVEPKQILKFLIDSNIDIINYELDYPSLNEVFIKISKS
jgi:ABC-2 type transport system ATP-binding protein